MLRTLVLAFTIAQSYVHSYEDHDDTGDHEESPWEYLFPDKVGFLFDSDGMTMIHSSYFTPFLVSRSQIQALLSCK